ncbi:hypothetical protein OG21DRAFT_564146 [Imleria badia]|nr:hypothetical protein OG21DRAFT_564146 [Imleria badia]
MRGRDNSMNSLQLRQPWVIYCPIPSSNSAIVSSCLQKYTLSSSMVFITIPRCPQHQLLFKYSRCLPTQVSFAAAPVSSVFPMRDSYMVPTTPSTLFEMPLLIPLAGQRTSGFWTIRSWARMYAYIALTCRRCLLSPLCDLTAPC